MIKDVVKVPLAVEECLRIQKKRFGKGKKRVCFVTGTHGDELGGQYAVWKLEQELLAHPEYLKGAVEVYPALNPLGVSTMTRSIPGVDLDMNRTFPGNEEGSFSDYLAAAMVKDLKGAAAVVDIHASNIYLREIPQVRVNINTADTLLPLARLLNMDFIWIHSAATVLESTLAHSLNSLGTPTLVVEMGIGMRITKEFGDRFVIGALALMRELGIWTGPVAPIHPPIVSKDGSVSFLNANRPGIFCASAKFTAYVEKGDEIGIIISPLTGEILEHVVSPVSGLVFTIREYPVVYEGSLLARILGGVR